jgi:hypothetical protein
VTTIKMRSRLDGTHVQTHVYMGPDDDHLVYCGALVQEIGHWQWFGAMLSLGARNARGYTKVIHEGDEQIIRDLAARGDARATEEGGK